MFRPGMRVGVAVSGGADSVCLLHVLREFDLQLHVIHLNHNLRGDESRGDADFVRDLAGSLGLPCTIREADVAALGGNREQAAREARLGLFRQILESGLVERVATGHTRSDQAETVLFRFLRGSGSAGLAGIRPSTAEGLVRPLIDVTRREVESYLRDRGIPWRDDSTNSSTQYARNRIRHELLPQLERDWNPALVDTLAHTADWALAEEAYWDEELTRICPSLNEHVLPCEDLRRLPLAVARRLVRRAIERAKGDLRGVDFRHVGAILELASDVQGHGRVQLPGLEVVRSFDWVRFDKPSAAMESYRLSAPVPGMVQIPGGLRIVLELIEKPETSVLSQCVYNDGVDGLDWRSLSGFLELRNWRHGDRYQPTGSTGEEKIKTLFQNARIPVWERAQWPVLVDGGAIVWSRRFGAAAGVVAHSGSTEILRVREVEAD